MLAEVIRLYDSELRGDPPPIAGVRYERAEGVIRARGRGNWIYARDLDCADANAVVAREAQLFTNLGENVEWKVYGYEQCRDCLPDRLAAHGFTPADVETLMICDLSQWRSSSPAPPGIRITRVSDMQGLLDLAQVMSEAFHDVEPGMLEELKASCLATDPIVFAYVAYAGEAPVASARMESPVGYSFGSLWGGCTLPAFRHRGIFRALVSIRVDDARRRGHSYLAVDAADTSKPILERLGFCPIATVRGWNLDRASAAR